MMDPKDFPGLIPEALEIQAKILANSKIHKRLKTVVKDDITQLVLAQLVDAIVDGGEVPTKPLDFLIGKGLYLPTLFLDMMQFLAGSCKRPLCNEDKDLTTRIKVVGDLRILYYISEEAAGSNRFYSLMGVPTRTTKNKVLAIHNISKHVVHITQRRDVPIEITSILSMLSTIHDKLITPILLGLMEGDEPVRIDTRDVKAGLRAKDFEEFKTTGIKMSPILYAVSRLMHATRANTVRDCSNLDLEAMAGEHMDIN